MLNGLDLMMLISLAVIAGCMVTIINKFIRYFNNKKKVMIYQENNRQDIKILEAKLTEIKLKNKGHSLDENISFIYNDESVGFSMEWGDIIGSSNNI